MCGRYSIDPDIAAMNEIIRRLNKEQQNQIKLNEIFPTNIVPVITMHDNAPVFEAVKWGFPHWQKKSASIINARSETALQRPMFRKPLQEKRCVIPSTGFYEWAHVDGKAKKEKFLLKQPDQSMLYMAGMINTFKSENGIYQAFVILTTAANESVTPIHDRMPVILESEEQEEWLKGSILNEVLTRTGPQLNMDVVSNQISFAN